MQDTRPARPRTRLRLIHSLLAALACLGCATLGDREPPLVPTLHQTRTGPFVVSSNVPIPADAPAIRGLRSLETEIEANLGIRVRPDAPPVEVYILNDRES